MILETDLSQDLAELQIEIEGYAKEYGLEFFSQIFEVLDYDSLNAVAAGGGFPKRYPHWRVGMSYDQLSKGYSWGVQKIYELVINTDPCYAYLMKSNAYIDQKLVMAHVYGHNDFFKNNYCFSKTNRKMLDQMANHASRIRHYMDRFDEDTVEEFVDCCLSIEDLIDPYSPFIATKEDDEEVDEFADSNFSPKNPPRLKVPRQYLDQYMNPKEYLDKQKQKVKEAQSRSNRFPENPGRDVMRFILENAPLETWQADVLSMVREEAYYFAPQRVTKIMNEGWASYWHSKILTEKALNPSEIVEFADRHAGVMVVQPGQLNPYKLGIELFRHIEDAWNKGRFGKEYEECQDMVGKRAWDKKLNKGREKIFEVRKFHNDVTFIDEFFTEDFCEDQRYYTYALNPRTNKYEIKTRDWREVKEEVLTSITNGGNPVIEVLDGNFHNRGELLLQHRYQGRELDLQYARFTLANLSRLWGRPANVATIVEGEKKVYCYKNGDFYEEKTGEKADKQTQKPESKGRSK